MRIKTNIKAGGPRMNHNENIAYALAKGLKVKTNVKAGSFIRNRNATLARNHSRAKGLKIKTNVRAGLDGLSRNHNQTLVRCSRENRNISRIIPLRK